MSAERRAIAPSGPAAYLRRVSLTRLIRFLTILALVLSPLAAFVASPASATAHHSAMASDGRGMAGHEMPGLELAGNDATAAMSHCNDMGETDGRPCGSGDCVEACAAVPAIPATGGQLEPRSLSHGPQLLPTLVSARRGLEPEAATPPPRSS